MCYSIWIQSYNTIVFRMAKPSLRFGHWEYNRVQLTFQSFTKNETYKNTVTGMSNIMAFQLLLGYACKMFASVVIDLHSGCLCTVCKMQASLNCLQNAVLQTAHWHPIRLTIYKNCQCQNIYSKYGMKDLWSHSCSYH